MTNRVWVLGDAVVDLVPDGNDRYLKCPGGAPANVAVGIARLAGDSAFIGRVGADPLGNFMRQVLDDEGVNTGHMVGDPLHRTSTVLVDLDDHGERSFTFLVKPSADLFLQADELPEFQAGQWLHLCSIALAQEPSRSAALSAMQAIRAAHGYVSFDPNIRLEVWPDPREIRSCLEQALELATVVKLSREELIYLCGPLEMEMEMAIEQLMERYPIQLLLVTLGGDGVLAHDGQQLHHLAARSIQVVDTTGAGDAFVAGLLAGLAEHPQLPSWEHLVPIIQQAQGCGALATTARGAMTALPSHRQLADFLQS
ncbi:MAG: aminoimidazole riboside kinase [Aeromonadaceae bacterium]|nr:aminoimidazole riboside kinase [Aeromonadaceae bacterium]